MKIIIFGARGEVGSRIVNEAISRRHEVTAVVRQRSQAEAFPTSITAQVADVANTEEIASLMAGHDLAISAIRPPDGREEELVSLTRSILDAAATVGLRVLVVGGAATLLMPDQSGHTVLTAPGFLPEAVVPIATACNAQHRLIENESRLDWSYLCPPAMLVPGERTGRYQTGQDVLLVNTNGESRISMEDFAVALLDEVEKPKHKNARFTVAEQ